MKAKPKRRSASVSNKRKKPIFKLPKLVDDPLINDDITDSFRRAFWVKEMNYTTKLVFDDDGCPESMNNAIYEPRVQTLIKENVDVVTALRERENRGLLPPVLIKYEKS
jgi:hypothetical protein